MREKTRRSIEDLIEMAERLQDHRFDEHIRGLGLGVHMEKQDDESWMIEFDLPDNKDLDATLYIFRFFDQQNEAFSFHGIKKLVKDPRLSDSFRKRISQIRKLYFNYLQGDPDWVESDFFEEGKDPNRGEIMRVVMNGWLGHRRNLKMRTRYKKWTRDPIRESVLIQVFTKIVYMVLALIKELLVLSKEELSIHTTPSNHS